jgi:hypothetical protein
MKFILGLIEKYSSKLNVWAWNKRWNKRDR